MRPLLWRKAYFPTFLGYLIDAPEKDFWTTFGLPYLFQGFRVLWLKRCELFFPLEGPESLRGGDPRKMGKNYKIPLPNPTPEIREKSPKKGVELLRKYKFCNYSVIFP